MNTREIAAPINRRIIIDAGSIPAGGHVSTCTGSPPFEAISKILSPRGCTRPPRLAPHEGVIITQSRLLELALKNPPPQEWYEGDESCPFEFEKNDDCSNEK